MAIPVGAILGALGAVGGQGGALSSLVDNLFLKKRREEQEKLIKAQTKSKEELLKTEAEIKKELLSEARKNMLLRGFTTNSKSANISMVLVFVALIVIVIILWKRSG